MAKIIARAAAAYRALTGSPGSTGSPPTTGEITRGQVDRSFTSSLMGLAGFGQPPIGSLKLYREMRGNPTIAMARAAGYGPCKAAQWTIDSEDDAPAGAAQFIEDVLMPMRASILNDLRFSLDFGRAQFEKVWEYKTIGGATRLCLQKLKPLLPEKTKPRCNEQTGEFQGIELDDVTLGPEKCWLYAYDSECGNFHGRSRNENARTVYHAWKSTLTRLGQYTTKVSGVTPIIRYPEGQGRDASGATVDNYDIAVKVLQSLGSGLGVAMPDTPSRWAQDLIRDGLKVDQLEAWRIEFLHAISGHGYELTALLQHLEKLLVRAWLVPERSVTEATLSGSRADSESAVDLATLVAQELLDDMIESLNRNVVDDLLEYNYGPDTRGKVYVAAEPLDDQARRLVRSMIKDVLTNPVNADMFFRVLNVDNMLDQAGVPRVVDTADVPFMQTPGVDENASALAKELGKVSAKPRAEPAQDDPIARAIAKAESNAKSGGPSGAQAA